jgi:hypothetical protein
MLRWRNARCRKAAWQAVYLKEPVSPQILWVLLDDLYASAVGRLAVLKTSLELNGFTFSLFIMCPQNPRKDRSDTPTTVSIISLGTAEFCWFMMSNWLWPRFPGEGHNSCPLWLSSSTKWAIYSYIQAHFVTRICLASEAKTDVIWKTHATLPAMQTSNESSDHPLFPFFEVSESVAFFCFHYMRLRRNHQR